MSLASPLRAQSFAEAQIKENIKAPRHWPLWGESTGHWWFPSQRASNAENISISWCHHVYSLYNHFCIRPSVCRPERFLGICQRTHGGIGLKFCMLMYLDRLQSCLDYAHGVLILLILALFFTLWNRSNLGVPGISQRVHGGNGLKFCILMYRDHLQN